MQILTPENFRTTRWKNGGGVTHEIAQVSGPNGYIWRLSIAEVDVNGAFSIFEGLSRILTVIEGKGILLNGPTGAIDAAHSVPVRFSGETLIDGILVDGPIRDFNVIFDDELVSADVRVLSAGTCLVLKALQGRTYAILCLARHVTLNDSILREGEVALFDTTPDGVSVSLNGPALLTTLDEFC